jgi:hypothetical protein
MAVNRGQQIVDIPVCNVDTLQESSHPWCDIDMTVLVVLLPHLGWNPATTIEKEETR